jgi:putative aminopeptidase FrvX
MRMMIQKKSNWKAPRIGTSQLKLLERLSNINGVSGDEGAVRDIVLEKTKPLADEYNIDVLGNILVTKRGKGSDLPRVMLAAHMDEIGFMLTHDDGKGFFRFSPVGGMDERQLVGKPVIVGKKQGLIIFALIWDLTTAVKQKLVIGRPLPRNSPGLAPACVEKLWMIGWA